MLNIPSEVKALFKRDDIFKNFHVTFPDGEFRDLNNEDIVSESVSFTESLCSQQYLKFGLTEASEIRFECYGVPNIRGVRIQCAMEIDVSSLGDAWILTHVPSEEVEFLTPQTVRIGSGIGYFRIPYGEFMVDSCQRNHEQRVRRSIVAYTKIYSSNSDFSEFEQHMMKKRRKSKTMRFNISDFVATALGYIPEYYSQSYNIKDKFSQSTSGSFESYHLGDGTPDVQYTLYVKRNSSYLSLFNDSVKNNCRIIKISLEKTSENTVMNELNELFEQYGITGGYRNYLPVEHTTEALSKELFRGTAKEIIIGNPYFARNFYGSADFDDWEHIQQASENVFIFETSTIMSIRDALVQSNGFLFGNIEIPMNITVQLCTGWTSRNNVVWEKTYNLYEDFTAEGFNIPVRNELQKAEVSFGKTLDLPNSPYGTVFSYFNAYSITKLVNGYFELMGIFLRQNRDKSYEEFKVKNSVHETVTRSQYSNVFFEDDEVQPVGSIRFKFKDQKSDKASEYDFAYANPSVYDMTDNYVLQNLARNKNEKDSVVEKRIKAMLDAGFIANVEYVNYVKSDIEMQALPYVESGDTVDAITEDNETVETIVFNHTVKGIQMLRDTIESAGGELIGRTEND